VPERVEARGDEMSAPGGAVTALRRGQGEHRQRTERPEHADEALRLGGGRVDAEGAQRGVAARAEVGVLVLAAGGRREQERDQTGVGTARCPTDLDAAQVAAPGPTSARRRRRTRLATRRSAV
jgi:hypothetical protein